MAQWDWLGIRTQGHAEEAKAEPSGGSIEPVFREGYVDFAADPKSMGDFEIKGAVLGLNDSLGSLLTLGDPNSLHTVQQFYMAYERSSAVSVPINAIAEDLASITPVMKNMQTNETDETHDILKLIRKPHPLFSQRLFLKTMAMDYLIADETVVVALGSTTKPPVQLQPVSPKGLTLEHDRSTGAPVSAKLLGALSGRYVSRPIDMGAQFTGGGDRVLKLLRGYSTKNDSLLRGQSTMVSIGRDIWQQIEGANYNLALLRQGGRTSLVFHFKSPMGREEFEETRKKILKSVEGADNAGRVLVTKGGEMDIHEPSGSSRDMEFEKTQKSARNVAALAYRYPVILLSTDAATFQNFEKSILAKWDDAVIPLAGRLLGGLAEWLFPRYKLDPEVWTLDFDRMEIDALRARFLAELKERVEIGVETHNEIRRTMPNRPDDPHGNEILVSGTLQPLSAVAQAPDDGLPPSSGAKPPSADPPPDPAE